MKRKIRVLHLIDSLDLGGAQTLLLECLPRFDRNVYDVTLATFHANRHTLFLKRARQAGIRIVALSPARALPLYAVTLPALLFSGRYDVVHCHLYASNWLGKPVARLLGVPVVIGHDHCFDSFRFRPPWRQLDRWSAGFADLTLVISSSLAGQLAEREKLDPSRLVVLPNGFAPPAAESPKCLQPTNDSGLRWIGAAGRLVGWKRFERFLALAKALSALDDRYRFVLAGDGPARGELRAVAERLGLQERVIWPGAVPTLQGFFARVHAFVLTSDLEGAPMVLLEAFAHRVPTATFAVNQERQQLARETLLLSPSTSAERWAQELHQFLEDAPRRERIIDAAHRALTDRFSLDRQVAAMDAHYRRLLKDRNDRRRELRNTEQKLKT